MPNEISNLREAISLLRNRLEERGFTIQKVEDLSQSGKFGNARLFTTTNEIYHLKYTKTGYLPKDSVRVSEGAKELDQKLKFTIRTFGNGDLTINGIDEDLLIYMIEKTSLDQKECFFTTVLQNGTVLWCRAMDFYNFVMRYDTFFKFPKSNVPVCEVPMGWLLKWENPLIAYPTF